MTKFRTIALAAALLAAGAAADAATFDFAYSVLPAEGVPAIVASGRIEATDLGGFFSVDDVTGKRGDDAITGYDFFDDAPQTFAYANGTASDVDFLYRIGADSFEGRFPGNGAQYGTEFTNANMSALVTAFTLTPAAAAAVPEPATWATMIAGLGAVGAGLRRRRRGARIVRA